MTTEASTNQQTTVSKETERVMPLLSLRAQIADLLDGINALPADLITDENRRRLTGRVEVFYSEMSEVVSAALWELQGSQLPPTGKAPFGSMRPLRHSSAESGG